MRIPSLLLILLSALLPTLSSAAQQPTSFCKCVCGNNSTIIALNPPPASDGGSSSSSSGSSSSSRQSLLRRDTLQFSFSRPALYPRADEGGDQKHHRRTCADCNRAFCLDQGLQICKGVKEGDIFASCFRTSHSSSIGKLCFLHGWTNGKNCRAGFSKRRAGGDTVPGVYGWTIGVGAGQAVGGAGVVWW